MTGVITRRPQPVRPGTAEQLARIAHFRALDLPEVEELDIVAGFLLGDVGDVLHKQELWGQLQDDCHKLWHLLTDDWDDRDLDELTEAEYEASYFPSQGFETDARYEKTVARLAFCIDRDVWLARVEAAARTASAHEQFEAEVSTGPIVDNASERLYAIGELEYDGPRCADEGCDTAVDIYGDRCEDCAGRCTECGREVVRPGLCFDCDREADYVGGFAPGRRGRA